jgi:hypothetical protein
MDGIFTPENIKQFLHVIKDTLVDHVNSQGGIGSVIKNSIRECEKEDKGILEEYHIYSKKDWKNFIRAFHPDKTSPDDEDIIPEDVVKIIEEGKNRGW